MSTVVVGGEDAKASDFGESGTSPESGQESKVRTWEETT